MVSWHELAKGGEASLLLVNCFKFGTGAPLKNIWGWVVVATLVLEVAAFLLVFEATALQG
jgi:Na+-transporting NADH:ubiquinone oxidoreductase subunit NqrB